MMKRRYLLVVVLAIAGGVGVLVTGALREREPGPELQYAGKSLRGWVLRYVTRDPQFGGIIPPAQFEETDDAIRHIGTNALPHLLKWIRYEKPVWKRKLDALVNPILECFTSWKVPDNKEKERLADGAASALIGLGLEAVPAFGGLTKLVNDPNMSASAERAAEVLSSQRAGLAPLFAVITNQQATAMRKQMVCSRLGLVGHNRSPVPALLDMINLNNSDANWDLRDLATNALRAIDPQALATNKPPPIGSTIKVVE